MLALKVVVLLQLLCVQAPLPVMEKYAGFRMNNCDLSAIIQLETFVDPLSPDSKFVHQVLKNLSALYKPDELCIRIVPFPSISRVHTYEVTTSVYQIVNALGESVFLQWLEALYAVQDVFSNENGASFTRLQVREKVHGIAKKTFPSLAKIHWTEESARLRAVDQLFQDWAYSCIQGMHETELFILNGVPVEATKEDIRNTEEWRTFIDELLHPESEKQRRELT